MSFFGFDTSGHNKGAPGFSQAHDPFAGLSRREIDQQDALEFEDTYDGLGDQLEETGDAFNDDTFGGGIGGGGGSGGGGVAPGRVGKDFDSFGQTAKVADAIEEEHLRYHRQQPPQKAQANYAAPPLTSSYYGGETGRKPARTGYEKYRENEPIPDLHVDRSIWGIGPSKSAQQSAAPTVHAESVQPPQTGASRKMMSLEEVEAAMRSQTKPGAQLPLAEQSQDLYAGQPQQPQHGQVHYQQQQQQQHQQPHSQSQLHGHGHPVQILQRPLSKHSPTPPIHGGRTPPIHPQQQQQHHPQHIHPTQILQNPNRLSGDASRLGAQGHQVPYSQPQAGGPRGPQMHQGQPQPLSQMTDEEKAAFLEQEARRAKRNHKIWLLSKDNGLMTPQDKNFITRIQLQQLVTATGTGADQASDLSINEDFYYQVYSHIRAGQRQNPSQPLSNFAQTYLYQTGGRHGGGRRHGRLAENHFQRMEQQVQRAVEAAKNKPKNPQLVIAGSLGKISFSNSKTPKPLVNIKRTEAEVNRQKETSGNAIDKKTVLRNVEKVYSTMMKIEDHVRHIPPPPNDAEGAERHRQWTMTLDALNAKLWDELKVHEPIGATVPHPFIAFLSCAKGKRAIPRIFPHLSFEQRTTILTMIIYHLEELDVVQGAINVHGQASLSSRMRENIELFISTVMPSLMQYFNDTQLDIVDGVLSLVATKLNVDYIARTRIGVSIVTLILSRAVLLKQMGAGTPQDWEKWDHTFETLFNKLEPSLPYMFPGNVNTGEDVYVWQLLAAMGVSATHDQQTRLVLAVKDRVLDTVNLAKTLPTDMSTERLGSVNLFMRSIGLDVELLQ